MRHIALAFTAICAAALCAFLPAAPALAGPPGGGELQLVQQNERWRPGAHLDRGPGFSFERDRGARTFGYEYAPAPYYGLRAYRPGVTVPAPSQRTVTPGVLPWSERWYVYCEQKYRSFDRRTGTFTTYAGEQRVCR